VGALVAAPTVFECSLARRSREISLSTSEAIVLPDGTSYILRWSVIIFLVSTKIFRRRVFVTERSPEPILEILSEDVQRHKAELLSLEFRWALKRSAS